MIARLNMLKLQSLYCNRGYIHVSFLVTLTLLFLLVMPRAASLEFNYQQIGDKANALNFSGDAYRDKQVVQLTRFETNSTGRVIYYKLFHLWDNNTGKVADFTTHFTFIFDAQNQNVSADGMTFFLARPNFPLPYPRDGIGLGLGNRQQLGNRNFTKEYPFVAVEFDNFVNEWDPQYEHVGIDVNSILSTTTPYIQWFTSKDERGYDANITYNSYSNILNVSITGYKDNVTIKQNLSYEVNLRDILPNWVEVGFSAATGIYYQEHTLSSWSFNSSFDPKLVAPPSHKKKIKTGMVVGMGLGGFVLIGGLGLISIGLWKKWTNGTEEEEDDFEEYMGENFERGAGPRKYSYAELAKAASGFKDEHKLGQGGFGGVYRGYLKDIKSHVAIKRISEDSHQGIKEFASEVRIISRLRHRNLVQLIGWCHEKKKLLLVYEYMQNGSLDIHLSKKQCFLKWAVRYNIAQGLASALVYLHEEWEQCVVHRDIKPSNIMLDSEFNAKLGDFGLARFVDHAKSAQTTALAGTFGYLAPESTFGYKSSKESDVYSFGVVALEIACGRKPISHKVRENEIHIVEWVWELYGGGRIIEAADPILDWDFDEEQIKCLMIVGLWCAHPDHNSRPSMRQVMQVLNFEAPLPNLPSSLPVPTYLGHSSIAPFSITSSEDGQKNQIKGSSSNTDSSGTTTTF
ncbi:hypothetical protein VNO78_03335 [Psophocarpus tetragonolobus]|uniref:Protein kinase domain-containing protein n=1 Tax=Psophocarpus tetragonolobus TaxID=3891 RepID=A0AAN9T458_PSOTE